MANDFPEGWTVELPPSDGPLAKPGPGAGELTLELPPGAGRQIVSPPGQSAREETTQAVKDFLRAASDASTFGGGNRLEGLGRYHRGEAESYSGGVDQAVKGSEQAQARSPVASFFGNVAGGVGTGAALGGLNATAVPYLASRLGRVGASIGEAGLFGAGQGAGHTYTGKPGDYVANAIEGGVTAAPFGILSMGSGAAGAGASRNFVPTQMPVPPGMPAWMGSVPPRLINQTRNDPAGLAPFATGARGDRAMLTDVPSFLPEAQGAAINPTGPAQQEMLRNLTTRNETASDAIHQGVDRLLGPSPPSLRAVQENVIQPQIRALRPYYQQVLNGPNARAVETRPIADWLEAVAINDRGTRQTAAARVRGQLNITGDPDNLDPRPSTLHATRSSIKSTLRKDRDTPGGTLEPAERSLLQDAVRRMTTELQDKVPGLAHLDSVRAELGARRAALDPSSAASRIFDPGRNSPVVRPEDVRIAWDEAGRPKGSAGPSQEQHFMRMANRAELDRVLGNTRGTAATGGPDELAALRGELSPYNRQKMAIVQGQRPTDAVIDLVGTENEQRAVNTAIQGGSQTAQRLAAKQGQELQSGDLPVNATLWSLAAKGVNWAKDQMFAQRTAANRDAIARYLASNDPAVVRAVARQLQAAVPAQGTRNELVRTLMQGGTRGASAGFVPKDYATE